MTRRHRAVDARTARTLVYVGLLATLSMALAIGSVRAQGIPLGPDLFVFLLLGVALPLIQDVEAVETRVRIDITSIVLLAAQTLIGPAGAACVGAIAGSLQGRGLAWYVRVFNAAQISLMGLLGGVAFILAGGTADPRDLSGVGDVIVELAVPLFVANVVQAAANLLLIAGVVRVAQGVPMRLQIASVLRGTGLAYTGFGVIALLMVILWRPSGLGPVAAAIVLAPLLVAQWVYRQRADEIQGQQRVLGVLVAAVEAKAPHLTGHSARVAELSGRMAEHLGLTPQQVADTRTAGMLHDVGQTSLSTRAVRTLDLADMAAGPVAYPEAGAALLDDLTFLHGALDPIRRHREALRPGAGASLPARIVALADRYDLLSHVGTAAGSVHAPSQARDLAAEEALASEDGAELVRALDAALLRMRSEEPTT